MSVKEKVLFDPVVELKNNNLIIEHDVVSENAIYDICSLEGRILITGKLGVNGITEVDLTGYPSGHYNVFILDGANVFKNIFILT